MKIGIKNTILLLAIPLLVSYYLVQSSYIHYHHFSDGHIVAHSHPYQNNGDGNTASKHNHTSSELILLQLFDGNYSSNIQIVVVDIEVVNYYGNSIAFYTSFCSLLKENKLLLRGPPELV